MHFNMDLPGLEDVIVTKQENRGDLFYIFCEMERQLHQCPNCANWTDRIHDYREQKINHLKIFERRGTLIYKKRRYACNECGKRFYENNNIVERYQRNSIEFNQSLGFRLITGSSFTDTAHLFDISPSTALRRFDKISDSMLGQVDELPSVISIDEYKGDTDAGKYQLIIVDPVERKPLDILPNRSKKELIRYLRKKGSNVKVVVMDMSPSF